MALSPQDIPESFEKPIGVKTEIHDTEGGSKKLALTVPATEVDKVWDSITRELASQVSVPGFRPGKVPKNVVERILKNEIGKRALGETVARAFQSAIKNEKLDVVGEPKLDLEKITIQRGKDLAFEVEVDLKPSFELGNYKGLPVEQEEVEVFQEEIDGELDELARRHAESVEAPAGTVIQDLDMVLGAMRYTAGGKEIFTAPEHGLFLHEGEVLGAYGKLDKSFLVGAKAGEKRTAELTLDNEFPVTECRGMKATLEYEVKSIRRPQIPPVDDELAKRLGLKDLATLKDRIRERLHEDLSDRVKEKVRNDLIERVIGNSPFGLPKRLLESQGARVAANHARMLERLGMSDEGFAAHGDELRKSAAERAERELRTFFILDALAAKENLTVGEEEVDEELVRIARQRHVKAQDLFEQLKESGELDVLKNELLHRKAMDFLVEQAEVKVTPRKKPAHGEAGHVHGPGCQHGAEETSAAAAKPEADAPKPAPAGAEGAKPEAPAPDAPKT